MALLHPEEGRDGKTERGTEKKRTDARKEGKIVVSNEVNTVVVLAVAVSIFMLILPMLRHRLTIFVQNWAQLNVVADWEMPVIHALIREALIFCAWAILPIGLAAMLGSIGANVAQTQFFFQPETLKWKFSGLNPANGIKELFSKESLIKLVISMLKVLVISLVVWSTVRTHVMEIIFMHRLTILEAITWFLSLLHSIIWRVIIFCIIVAVIDWIKEKRKYEQSIMMSKQEIKDEHKNQEGNPQMKQKMRGKMRDLSMSRMMAAVPDATVVITNPTRLAVVIKYDSKSMGSPIVVAKGQRLVAKRIRRIAAENGVPVIERKPLARAIYKNVKIGQPVPGEFYEGVAELLAYLYRLGNKHIRSQLGR